MWQIWGMWRGLVLVVSAGLVWVCWPDDSCAPFQQAGSEVWLAIGQSNAANHAAQKLAGVSGVYAFDGKRCVPAQDPLPGASGTGGSVWVALANRWIASGKADRILLISRAQESTAIAEWQPGGALFGRIAKVQGDLGERQLRVRRIFWTQGESDAALGTSERDYANGLAGLVAGLRRIGLDAPMHVALASICGPSTSAAVRRAQLSSIGANGIKQGPDLDRIGGEKRYERCHFTAAGQQAAADAWAAAIN